jgi:hypothetical protein
VRQKSLLPLRLAVQVIYGCQKLATCSIDSGDMGPNGNSLGVMITLRMRLHCAIVRAGQSEPEQVRVLVCSWVDRFRVVGRGALKSRDATCSSQRLTCQTGHIRRLHKASLLPAPSAS